ncbi:MAG: ABC transporter permease [Clostridiales bacterium]|nr:ABC transporter permease [Clostridiales bacterium]
MRTLKALVLRNTKMFFKDKGMFFTALITPAILLVLYISFLYNVYEDSFSSIFPAELNVDEKLVKGLVGGLLLSSLLAVSCVTVSFCANLFMVQDKVTGARYDLTIAPVKPHTLALGYYLSTAISGLVISCIATLLGMIYLAVIGWYMSFTDVCLMFLDVLLLVLFGTALSSLVCYPLSTQGQISAVGTIVSSGYGFICGAYMPISSFSAGLRNTLSFLPGTYATSLIRNHALAGVFREMESLCYPEEIIKTVRDVADCNLYFFNSSVATWQMYLILIGSILFLAGMYVLIHVLRVKKTLKSKNK